MKSILQIIDKNKKMMFMVMVAICVGTYAVILCNRTMPYAEGWYSYYAKCINNGLKPYKDFDYLFPPIFIYFIALVTRIFGYKIIILRIIGVLFFSIIGMVLYLCLNEVFSEAISSIAAITACLYLQSEVVQVFYDYVRVMDIFALLSTLFLLKAIKQFGNDNYYENMLILSGVSSAFFTLIKQNMGIVFTAFCVIAIICSGIVMQREQKIIKNVLYFTVAYILPLIIVAIIMALDGSLGYFLKNTGADALAAKGGVLDILFAWIPNNSGSFESGWSNAIVIFGALLICFIIKNTLPDDVNSRTMEILAVVFGFICITSFICFAISKDLAIKVSDFKSYSPYTLFIVGATLFWAMVVVAVMKRIRNEEVDVRKVLLIIIGGAYFAISWGCGMSGGLSQGQATLCVALIVALLFDCLAVKYTLIPKAFMIVVCAMVTLQCAEFKMENTYNWWGMDEDDYWSSNYSATDISDLSGIRMSEETRDVYAQIYDIVKEHTEYTDSIYCFPQIPIFYSICDRFDPGVRAKVQWFDVASDKSIMNDMSIIENNPPKVIIIYKTSSYAYESHENLFRNGTISATRKMKNFLMNYAMENDYTFAGVFSSAQNNSILVYYKDSQSDIKGPSFAGEGTKDNPYLITDGEDLIRLSNWVNNGNDCDGYYFAQTNDIDMSGVTDWRPIGLFDKKNYFYGIYNGNGYIVSGLRYDASENVGLFGVLGGMVCNLGVVDCSFNGLYSGVISSHSDGANGIIINCYTDSDISGFRAGGIADNFGGFICNCVSVGKTHGIQSAGGVSYSSGRIRNVYAFKDNVESGVYNDDRNGSVTYCAEEFLKSELLSNDLNENVKIVNNHGIKEFDDMSETIDEELVEIGEKISLLSWTIGEGGYPILVK